MRAHGLEVADIFRQIGPAYRDAQAAHLSRGQRRVMSAIERCRTAALGGHVEQCDACGHQRIAYNSCRNRHCPKCQSLARAQWLQQRQAELLPVEYFRVVFKMPQEIAAMAYQNKAVVYDILFRATSETLRTIAADPRRMGAEIGFIAILHTWGRTRSITRTCIAWYAVAACPPMGLVGWPAGPASSFPCGCSRGCSGGCSSSN